MSCFVLFSHFWNKLYLVLRLQFVTLVKDSISVIFREFSFLLAFLEFSKSLMANEAWDIGEGLRGFRRWRLNSRTLASGWHGGRRETPTCAHPPSPHQTLPWGPYYFLLPIATIHLPWRSPAWEIFQHFQEKSEVYNLWDNLPDILRLATK